MKKSGKFMKIVVPGGPPVDLREVECKDEEHKDPESSPASCQQSSNQWSFTPLRHLTSRLKSSGLRSLNPLKYLSSPWESSDHESLKSSSSSASPREISNVQWLNPSSPSASRRQSSDLESLSLSELHSSSESSDLESLNPISPAASRCESNDHDSLNLREYLDSLRPSNESAEYMSTDFPYAPGGPTIILQDEESKDEESKDPEISPVSRRESSNQWQFNPLSPSALLRESSNQWPFNPISPSASLRASNESEEHIFANFQRAPGRPSNKCEKQIADKLRMVFQNCQSKLLRETARRRLTNTIPAILRVIVGVAQLVSGAALSVIFALGSVLSKNARKNVTHSIRITAQGLNNIVMGALETPPVLGSILAQREINYG